VLRRFVVLAAAFAVLAPAAQAGTATIHQCQTTRAITAETDLLSTAGHSEMRVDDRCATGGGYGLLSTGPVGFNPQPDFRRELTIDAPSGTQFVGGQIVRQMARYVYRNEGNISSGWGYVLTAGADIALERCGAAVTGARGDCTADAGDEAQFPSSVLELATTPRTTFKALVGCNAGDSQAQRCYHHKANPGTVFSRMTFLLRDDAAPNAQASGPLVTESPVRSGQVTLSATDQGLGVYRVKLLVDGTEAEVQPWDPGDARCRDTDTSNADPYEFAAGLPCKTQPGSRTFTFSKLPAGSHNLKVVVEDAAGGQFVAVDRTVVVDPPGPANGTNASAQARLVLSSPAARTITSSYANRGTLRLIGRVVAPSGQGVGNAVLDLYEKPALPGAVERRLALGSTAADGTFEITVPAGASRTLRLVYRDRLGSAAETSVVSVVQRVKAGLRFDVKRKARTLSFSGRVLGHRPPKAVQIQVRVAGTWRVLAEFKTRTGGSLRFRYRLKSARRGEKLRLRLVVPGERGFPYLGAASRTQTVRVG